MVIGGGVAQVGKASLGQVRAAVAERAMLEFARTPILPAALGVDSGLVGAALQAWEAWNAPRSARQFGQSPS